MLWVGRCCCQSAAVISPFIISRHRMALGGQATARKSTGPRGIQVCIRRRPHDPTISNRGIDTRNRVFQSDVSFCSPRVTELGNAPICPAHKSQAQVCKSAWDWSPRKPVAVSGRVWQGLERESTVAPNVG